MTMTPEERKVLLRALSEYRFTLWWIAIVLTAILVTLLVDM